MSTIHENISLLPPKNFRIYHKFLKKKRKQHKASNMSLAHRKNRIRNDRRFSHWFYSDEKVNKNNTPKPEAKKRREMVKKPNNYVDYEMCEVERILYKYVDEDITWWLIKWVGHNITKVTFETVLDDCKECLADFKKVEQEVTFKMTNDHVDLIKNKMMIFKLEKIIRKKQYGTQVVVKWEGIPLTTTEDYTFMDKNYPTEVEEFEKTLEDERSTTGKKRKRKIDKRKKKDSNGDGDAWFPQVGSFLEEFIPRRKQRKRKAKKKSMEKKTFSPMAKRKSEIKIYYEKDCMLKQ